MDLDVEQVALPDMAYDVSVKMPSDELQRVCRDLSALSESGIENLFNCGSLL